MTDRMSDPMDPTLLPDDPPLDDPNEPERPGPITTPAFPVDPRIDDPIGDPPVDDPNQDPRHDPHKDPARPEPSEEL